MRLIGKAFSLCVLEGKFTQACLSAELLKWGVEWKLRLQDLSER